MNAGMILVIAICAAFLLQIFFSMLQMKHFSKEFVKLRKKGKVAIGRQGGGFFAGAIVMFLIDEDGIIIQGKKMEGITVLARVKDFNGFEGRFVGDLTEEDGPKNHKNLKRAIKDAANNYNMFKEGKTIPPKPSPFKKAGNLLARAFSGKKARKEADETSVRAGQEAKKISAEDSQSTMQASADDKKTKVEASKAPVDTNKTKN